MRNSVLFSSKALNFEDDKIHVIQKQKFLMGLVENIVGYQHFLLFPQCFPKTSYLGSLTLSQTSPGFYVPEAQVL